jgi:gp16 family phage-associated protein
MTPEKAKALKLKLREQGVNIGQWADRNGFQRPDVYRVLNGYTPCLRGTPHRIAVALGLKDCSGGRAL